MWRSGCFISAFMVWCSFHFSSCQVFAIVVFSTITAEGYVNPSNQAQVKCVFNQNEGACHYGVGIGIIAFLASFAFLLADALLTSMSNAQERKYVVMADLGFSGEAFFKSFCVGDQGLHQFPQSCLFRLWKLGCHYGKVFFSTWPIIVASFSKSETSCVH